MMVGMIVNFYKIEIENEKNWKTFFPGFQHFCVFFFLNEHLPVPVTWLYVI